MSLILTTSDFQTHPTIPPTLSLHFTRALISKCTCFAQNFRFGWCGVSYNSVSVLEPYFFSRIASRDSDGCGRGGRITSSGTCQELAVIATIVIIATVATIATIATNSPLQPPIPLNSYHRLRSYHSGNTSSHTESRS